MTTEEAFLADIRDNPRDDVPRLVYADWLEEYGDETARQRAELIRVQCRIARLPSGGPEWNAVLAREGRLREALTGTWFAPLDRLGLPWYLRRGFVEFLGVSAAVFVEHGEVITRLAPAAELTVSVTAEGLDGLVASPHFRHVTRLEASGVRGGVCQALAASPRPPRLDTLLLRGCGIDAAAWRELAKLDLARLRVLNLGLNALGDEGAGELLRAPALANLQRLILASNGLRAAAGRALAGAAHLTRLVELGLGSNALDDDALEAIAGAAHLSSLRRLDVRRNAFGVRGARALARSTRLRQLAELNAGGNDLGHEGRTELTGRFGQGAML